LNAKLFDVVLASVLALHTGPWFKSL